MVVVCALQPNTKMIVASQSIEADSLSLISLITKNPGARPRAGVFFCPVRQNKSATAEEPTQEELGNRPAIAHHDHADNPAYNALALKAQSATDGISNDVGQRTAL